MKAATEVLEVVAAALQVPLVEAAVVGVAVVGVAVVGVAVVGVVVVGVVVGEVAHWEITHRPNSKARERLYRELPLNSLMLPSISKGPLLSARFLSKLWRLSTYNPEKSEMLGLFFSFSFSAGKAFWVFG